MFYEQLRLIRKASGKTQKELAEYLQISAQSVSKWEKGESLPTLEYLPLIAKFFGCSVNAFFTDIEEGTRDKLNNDIDEIRDVLDIEDRINCALRHFKINAEVKKIHYGIRILTFVVEMYEGVGISDINKRAKDIIHQIGEDNITFNTTEYKNNTFAIQIPKKKFDAIPLDIALNSQEYLSSACKVPIIIGYDSNDNLIIDDLTRLPHLIVGGCTGSGKSVFLSNLISCIVSKFSPEEVKLLISDLKMCEFTYAEHLPHLYGDILTSCQDTVAAMKSVVEMMNIRYTKLEESGLRNINEYNKSSGEIMSRLIVIIDDLADVMLQNRAIEELLMRIAQKGRAVGIHLILVSQRSSVNVFTGVLKANIPSRALLRVETTQESKVILDEAGAENLALHGDMLYSSIMTECKPIRVQLPYINELSIINLVKQY